MKKEDVFSLEELYFICLVIGVDNLYGVPDLSMFTMIKQKTANQATQQMKAKNLLDRAGVQMEIATSEAYFCQFYQNMSLIRRDAGEGGKSKKKIKQDIAYVRNWQYIEKEDLFICPNKRPVTFKRYSTQKDTYGFVRDTKFMNVKIVVIDKCISIQHGNILSLISKRSFQKKKLEKLIVNVKLMWNQFPDF